MRKPRILAVDDTPSNLVALGAVLERDFELVLARSGPEAIAIVQTDASVDVILMDVQMPGMDGFETAARIKRREKTRDIPIIFMTAGTGGPHQTMRGYATGAVDYLAKPFDPWVLKSKVSVFVDLHLKREMSVLDHLSAGLGGSRRRWLCCASCPPCCGTPRRPRRRTS